MTYTDAYHAAPTRALEYALCELCDKATVYTVRVNGLLVCEECVDKARRGVVGCGSTEPDKSTGSCEEVPQ